MSVEQRSGSPDSGSGGGPLLPQDIKPEDCTLANLAAVLVDADTADDCKRRLENRETTKDNKPALGCIACSAKITLDGGFQDEPGGVGLCMAPFIQEAREIVAPKTHARARAILEQALRASK